MSGAEPEARKKKNGPAVSSILDEVTRRESLIRDGDLEEIPVFGKLVGGEGGREAVMSLEHRTRAAQQELRALTQRWGRLVAGLKNRGADGGGRRRSSVSRGSNVAVADLHELFEVDYKRQAAIDTLLQCKDDLVVNAMKREQAVHMAQERRLESLAERERALNDHVASLEGELQQASASFSVAQLGAMGQPRSPGSSPRHAGGGPQAMPSFSLTGRRQQPQQQQQQQQSAKPKPKPDAAAQVRAVMMQRMQERAQERKRVDAETQTDAPDVEDPPSPPLSPQLPPVSPHREAVKATPTSTASTATPMSPISSARPRRSDSVQSSGGKSDRRDSKAGRAPPPPPPGSASLAEQRRRLRSLRDELAALKTTVRTAGPQIVGDAAAEWNAFLAGTPPQSQAPTPAVRHVAAPAAPIAAATPAVPSPPPAFAAPEELEFPGVSVDVCPSPAPPGHVEMPRPTGGEGLLHAGGRGVQARPKRGSHFSQCSAVSMSMRPQTREVLSAIGIDAADMAVLRMDAADMAMGIDTAGMASDDDGLKADDYAQLLAASSEDGNDTSWDGDSLGVAPAPSIASILPLLTQAASAELTASGTAVFTVETEVNGAPYHLSITLGKGALPGTAPARKPRAAKAPLAAPKSPPPPVLFRSSCGVKCHCYACGAGPFRDLGACPECLKVLYYGVAPVAEKKRELVDALRKDFMRQWESLCAQRRAAMCRDSGGTATVEDCDVEADAAPPPPAAPALPLLPPQERCVLSPTSHHFSATDFSATYGSAGGGPEYGFFSTMGSGGGEWYVPGAEAAGCEDAAYAIPLEDEMIESHALSTFPVSGGGVADLFGATWGGGAGGGRGRRPQLRRLDATASQSKSKAGTISATLGPCAPTTAAAAGLPYENFHFSRDVRPPPNAKAMLDAKWAGRGPLKPTHPEGKKVAKPGCGGFAPHPPAREKASKFSDHVQGINQRGQCGGGTGGHLPQLHIVARKDNATQHAVAEGTPCPPLRNVRARARGALHSYDGREDV